MEARYNDLLAQHVTPILRNVGFRKKGPIYSRTREYLSHLVSIQTSKWNDQSEFRFTIDCGVLVPGVVEVYANKKVGSPKIEDCCMSIRIGFLTSEKTDLWWALSESAHHGDGAIGQDVVRKTRELILPFLDQFDTIENIIGFLTDTHSSTFASPRSRAQRLAYAAIVAATTGQLGRAKKLIESAKLEAVGSPIEKTVDRVEETLAAS